MDLLELKVDDLERESRRFYRAKRRSDGGALLLRVSERGEQARARARRLFERELELGRDLDAAGILTALDVIDNRGRAALVFADAPGFPLDHVLGRHSGLLPPATALDIAAQLASALATLHQHDIIHRDVRPANVIYDQDSGRALLTGLGHAMKVSRETGGIHASDQQAGDPAYLAPEATGRLNRRLDHRADLYSLGVVLFEMLTGRPVFDEVDPVALIHAHIALDPPLASTLRTEIPSVVSTVVGKLLAKAAEERYQTALGLCYDLERCVSELQKSGEVRPFELGEHDLTESFELPEALFGREKELRWLEETLMRAAAGDTLARLVAGFSGVGKTSLIEEIRSSVLARRGRFASGAFAPDSQARPYGGILTALHGLAQQMLGAQAEEARAWCERLTIELGAHLGVLTEALPELLNLVGETPTAPEVEPANARNRFYRCVARFLASFVPEQDPPAPLPRTETGPPKSGPLVLFLDDLHWVDPASLELLESLVDSDLKGFLLLGAYRDNQVGREHALARLIDDLRARGVDIETLELAPLAKPALDRLISRALRLPPTETAPLADLVYRKTAGNPFFARTFLRTLYQRRLLRFTDGARSAGPPPRWTWDLDAIAALEAMDSVIELVASRLTELPPASRRTLAVAAVLGKEIDVSVLAAVCGADETVLEPKTSGQIEEILIEACREGLLIRTGERFAFAHDRVREGAYALLSEEERGEYHLRMGRLLTERLATGQAQRDRWGVFELVDHLNSAAHRICEPEERRELVRLNAEAGRQARASGAFPAAFAYLSHAVAALSQNAVGEDPWGSDYELARTLYAETAHAAALAGAFEAAEQLTDTLKRNARSLQDALPAYETRIYLLNAQRDEEAAICLSLDVLRRFGVDIPIDPDPAQLAAAMASADDAVMAVLERVERNGVLNLPAMTDPTLLTISGILCRAALIAAWPRSRFLRLAACRLTEITAAHGVSSISPVTYIMLADVRFSELEDFPGGRRIGKLGLALLDHPAASGLDMAGRMLYDLAVSCHFLHPVALQKRFAEHFRRALECGDPHLAGGSGIHSSIAALLAGKELAEVEAMALAYREEVHRHGQLMMAQALQVVAHLAAALADRGTVEQVIETSHLAPDAVMSLRARTIGPEMMVRYLLSHREAALATARESLPIRKSILPIFPFDFYRALIFLDADVDRSELAPCLARLVKKARAAPEIYEHKLLLVKARLEHVAGQSDEALALYERAIEGARQQRFPHEEALARELTAELHLKLDQKRAAAAHLQEAMAIHHRWGARAKLDQLFERYPALVSVPAALSSSLDITSLQRAEIALSSELDLAKLLRRLITLLLQNAGARRGFLLREAQDHIVIEASGIESEVRLEELALDQYDGIATAVVRFVVRTHESLILDEPYDDPRFASDPYIARVRPRSILCFPLLHRGKAVEIIYLENDRSPDVFSPERATAARLLASHAAATLRNARLHQTLKREVESRRRAEADLLALKNRLEAENIYLQEEIHRHFEDIVGDSDALRRTLYKVEQVAPTNASVLLFGETGCGKELVARALHRLSQRRDRPLVKVNCAALPANLIESELFGHEKGAFTGALSRRVGRFELADSGTLFLDEIGDLPLELQAKLLRVLQEGEFERLGGTKTLNVDVRIVAATNRDLEQAMAEGAFRSDLYYRLTVFPIELPPLRERHSDVPLLVHYFVQRKQRELGKTITKIPQDVMDRLIAYDWPGNVRELENVVERALILSPGDTLLLEDALARRHTPTASGQDKERLVDFERAHILSVLEACQWKIKGDGNAADRLGLKAPTLRNRMKKLGIERPDR